MSKDIRWWDVRPSTGRDLHGKANHVDLRWMVTDRRTPIEVRQLGLPKLAFVQKKKVKKS